jgi:hypothetical protein
MKITRGLPITAPLLALLGAGLAGFARGQTVTRELVPELIDVDAHSVPGSISNTNGVFEPGETVQIVPSWKATLTTPQTFTGAASSLTGAPGPTYTINAGSADYGTVNGCCRLRGSGTGADDSSASWHVAEAVSQFLSCRAPDRREPRRPYEILSPLGAGGIGRPVRDPKLRRDMVIKDLPASLTHDPDTQRTIPCVLLPISLGSCGLKAIRET